MKNFALAIGLAITWPVGVLLGALIGGFSFGVAQAKTAFDLLRRGE